MPSEREGAAGKLLLVARSVHVLAAVMLVKSRRHLCQPVCSCGPWI